MLVQPYLFFDGRCEEALAFYEKAIGAKSRLMRFSESPEGHGPPTIDPANAQKIMHAHVEVGETAFMASDGECKGEAHFGGFSLSLTVADAAEAKRSFHALAEGGEIVMPLSKTFFSSGFGMLKDRFGVHWMVMSPP
ncbi:VOC family protein [Dyella halodurans]|uniref:VOC family protein n=1 Tax=Dyella halodurans TaxID=1920171 RepID=A0ABV9BYY2_9GAMM|nr:VOC family protein [Dyella halodurans]